MEQKGPDIIDEVVDTDRPLSLPEERDEAEKAGKLAQWEIWHKGLLEREAVARKRFKARMVIEVAKFGREAVEKALGRPLGF